MATIRREDIRARISIGGLIVETPDILSFSVSKSRTNPSASFQASIEVDIDSSTLAVGETVIIEAGLKDDLIRIFTGYIENTQVNPHWEKSDRFVLGIGGRDIMGNLDGKRFSRRQRCLGLGKMAIINGIVSKVQDKGRIRKENVVEKGDGGGRFVSGSLDLGEVPELIRTRSIDTANPYSLYAKSVKPANKPEEYDLIVTPGFITIPQNGSQIITCENCVEGSDLSDPTSGITWTSTNPDIIQVAQDPNDPKKVTVTQAGVGSGVVMEVGTC